MPRSDDSSIIALDRFIQATRDSGYKGTESALAELVDNSLQAGASRVLIDVVAAPDDADYPIRISVLDAGCGMDRRTLRQALRFGGSSRFNDRTGLGRYGMGLPNSSLSQARRVEVFTCRKAGAVILSYLDVDEIASGQLTEVPDPAAAPLPKWLPKAPGATGTLVVWNRCDRLDHRRSSTIARKSSPPPWGRRLPILPLAGRRPCRQRDAGRSGRSALPAPAVVFKGRDTLYGDVIRYIAVEAPSSGCAVAQTGVVQVCFSELPVEEWSKLPNEEKRRLGVPNGAGVSVVRADREIDCGWFFLGGKRRENYDDWWRCEVRFDPVLDEAFGITHTKQQIRPRDYLLELLAEDMENVARALNARARQAHLKARSVERSAEIERVAAERDRLLQPLENQADAPRQAALLEQLEKRHPSVREATPAAADVPMGQIPHHPRRSARHLFLLLRLPRKAVRAHPQSRPPILPQGLQAAHGK